MADRGKVIKGLQCCKSPNDHEHCLYNTGVHYNVCTYQLLSDALELLKEQEPRVMTLEEVIDHYSLPPVFVDDLGAQEDYLQDIVPLYFDFPSDDPWAVHWRGYLSVRQYLDDWKASYGKKWICWTGKPTDEQRKAVQWG